MSARGSKEVSCYHSHSNLDSARLAAAALGVHIVLINVEQVVTATDHGLSAARSPCRSSVAFLQPFRFLSVANHIFRYYEGDGTEKIPQFPTTKARLGSSFKLSDATGTYVKTLVLASHPIRHTLTPQCHSGARRTPDLVKSPSHPRRPIANPFAFQTAGRTSL